MKKLFAALAVCVSTVAFANNAQAPSEQQRQEGPKVLEATDLRSQTPGSSTEKAQDKYDKMEANEATGGSGQSGQDDRSLGEKTKDALGLSQRDKEQKKAEEDALFKSTEAFNVSGTVKSASGKELKLKRAGGLPEAELKVRDQTVVMLDGKRVKADAIPDGSSVRAKFNLDGGDMVAVHIDAKSNKNAATGGAGAAGTETKTEAKAKSAKNATKDAAHDTKNAAKDTVHDTKNATKDAAHDTKNAAKDAAHDTKNTAKDAAQDTKDAAHDATH